MITEAGKPVKRKLQCAIKRSKTEQNDTEPAKQHDKQETFPTYISLIRKIAPESGDLQGIRKL